MYWSAFNRVFSKINRHRALEQNLYTDSTMYMFAPKWFTEWYFRKILLNSNLFHYRNVYIESLCDSVTAKIVFVEDNTWSIIEESWYYWGPVAYTHVPVIWVIIVSGSGLSPARCQSVSLYRTNCNTVKLPLNCRLYDVKLYGCRVIDGRGYWWMTNTQGLFFVWVRCMDGISL